MTSLKIYNFRSIENLILPREGEMKFAQEICFVENLEELKLHPAKYVLFGIPEDIGIRANHGRPGAFRAWNSCLKALLNIQYNEFTHPRNLILLGEIKCGELMEKASKIDANDPNYYVKLSNLVNELDEVVSALVEKIIAAGKTPIIVGGGHNNAFGNIKGASRAIQQPLNVLNIDAHTDLGKLEFRHSGNAFSFAKFEGFLGKYAIFGIHQNYTPQYIFEEIKISENIEFKLLEDLMLLPFDKRNASLEALLEFVDFAPFGLEIDCDSIKNFSSSAQSPAGFDILEIRNFIRLAKTTNCTYLHLCEAAPDEPDEVQAGKVLSYFITDFMAGDIII